LIVASTPIAEATLTDQPQPTDTQHYWAQSAARWRQQQDDTPLRRFLGGSPLAVLVRLAVVSILVGALLMWLDIRPTEVFQQLADLVDRLWTLGFRSLRDLGDYIVAGAAIVVPVWLILRLLAYRSAR
jgi:hypothetical protein